MFICSVDGRSPSSIHLVLTVHGDDNVPRLLEGRRISRTVKPACVRDQFQQWRQFYHAKVDIVVCNPADGLPPELLEAFQDVSDRLEWVEECSLSQVLAAWQATVPCPPWLRGTLMSLVCSVAAPTPGSPWTLPVGYRWLQAWFSSQLADLDQIDSRDFVDMVSPTRYYEDWREVPF